MYTRRGDKGETSLFGPRRVPKDDPRVEAYGTIDELNAIVGMVIAGSDDRQVVRALKDVQRLLFVAGGDAASELGGAPGATRISSSDIKQVEKMTDELAKALPTLKNFILPGGTPTGALLHQARAVCRRAERRLVTASRAEKMNPELIPFFNRLSSYLFNLSRWENKRSGEKEDVWRPSPG